ncbi:MAG: hypothetical protein RL756_1609, partial [Pseudomonadota bacterium]
MSAWLALTIEVPEGAAEEMGDRLEALGAVAVTFLPG